MKVCLYIILSVLAVSALAQSPSIDEVVKQLDTIAAQINQQNELDGVTPRRVYQQRHALLSSLSRERMHELLKHKYTSNMLSDGISGGALIGEYIWGMVDGYGKGESGQQIAAEIADMQLPWQWRMQRIKSFMAVDHLALVDPEVPPKPLLTLPDAEGLRNWRDSIESFAGTGDYDNALLDSYEQARYLVALYAGLYPELGKLVIARDEAAFKTQPASAEVDLGLELVSTLNQMEERLRKHKGHKPFETQRPYFEKEFASSQFDLPEGIALTGSTVRNIMTEKAYPPQQSAPAANPLIPTVAPSPVASVTPAAEASKIEKPNLLLYLGGAVFVLIIIVAVTKALRQRK